MRIPWTARRSNLSTLKEINPEYSLEGLMLKLQDFGQLMGRVNSFEKTLMLGKIEVRRRGGQRVRFGWHHRLNGHEFEQTLGDSMGQGNLVCCSPWDHKESDKRGTEPQLSLCKFKLVSSCNYCVSIYNW